MNVSRQAVRVSSDGQTFYSHPIPNSMQIKLAKADTVLVHISIKVIPSL